MHSDNRPLKVLVVDDDPDIQDVIGLCVELNWPGSTLLVSSDGAGGIRKFRETGADLILLDLGLPDIDGISVCKAIRSESKVPIVMVTARNQESDVIKGLNAGADDYIVKPFSRGEFIARLTAVLRRAGALDECTTFRDGNIEIDFATQEVLINGTPVRLTAKEYALLARLVTNHGTVVTARELLETGWGSEYRDAVSYLDDVMEGITRKLGQSGRDAGIVKSAGIGYRYVEFEPAG